MHKNSLRIGGTTNDTYAYAQTQAPTFLIGQPDADDAHGQATHYPTD